MVELVDTLDSKSGVLWTCRFKSGPRYQEIMKNTSRHGELVSGCYIAPHLYFATPDELEQLVDTGEYIDFTDYKNACADLQLSTRNASPAFRTTALHLGRDLDRSTYHSLDDSLGWYWGNPNQGIRDQILFDTQWVADTVLRHDRGENEPAFSKRTWLIMGVALRGVVTLEATEALAKPRKSRL